MTPQERIKADAEAYAEKENSAYVNDYNGYIAGATAVHGRAQVLVDALEEAKSALGWYEDDATIDYIDKALEEWKGKEKQVELSCMVCGTKFMGPEPQMCCSGRDCGCMGLPVEPIVCSKECYDKGIPPQKGGSGVIEIN